MDERTFNECRNLLRPVKKALKNIDIKEANISEKDHLEKVKRHLLEIGDKINDHLSIYTDPDKIKEWRNYLWYFVSKFTTMNFERLKNLYRKFASTRDQDEMNKSFSSTSGAVEPGSSSRNTNYSISNSYQSSLRYDKYNNSRSTGNESWKNEK